MDTGPKNDSEKITFAIEGFRVSVQFEINKLLNKRGITKEELATRLNVSEDKINHIFSDNGNPTITMIAKIFFVLGEECNLVCKGDKNA